MTIGYRDAEGRASGRYHKKGGDPRIAPSIFPLGKA